jgi:hypothetical protein
MANEAKAARQAEILRLVIEQRWLQLQVVRLDRVFLAAGTREAEPDWLFNMEHAVQKLLRTDRLVNQLVREAIEQRDDEMLYVPGLPPVPCAR